MFLPSHWVKNMHYSLKLSQIVSRGRPCVTECRGMYMEDEYNWNESENDNQNIEFRKPGTKMKFKDTELQFGREMNYRWRDNIWLYGSKREAYQGRREDGLWLNPEETHIYRTTWSKEQRHPFPVWFELPSKPVCTVVRRRRGQEGLFEGNKIQYDFTFHSPATTW